MAWFVLAFFQSQRSANSFATSGVPGKYSSGGQPSVDTQKRQSKGSLKSAGAEYQILLSRMIS
jgi:hypothetical protein